MVEDVDREYYQGMLAECVREREEYNGEAQFRAIQVKLLMDALLTIRIAANRPDKGLAVIDRIFGIATEAIREATHLSNLVHVQTPPD